LKISFDDCNNTTISGKLGRRYHETIPEEGTYDTLTGTKTGVVGCIEGVAGKAVEFDNAEGNTGEVTFDYHSALDLETDATISVWIKQPIVQEASAFGRWYDNDQFAFRSMDDKWTFGAAFFRDDVYVETSVSSSKPVTLGDWTHFVIVAQRGDALRLYQNGELVGSKPLDDDFNFQFTKRPLRIGRAHHMEWDPDFKGAVDELAIWRTPFTADEVAALHCPD
jgi:hypothetical protein